MHSPARLQLSDPRITARDAERLAPIAEGLDSLTDVIGPPILDTNIRERDEPAHRRTATLIREAVKVTSGPDGLLEALDATIGTSRP
jgi:hypothetical protein